MKSLENDPILKIQSNIDPTEARQFFKDHSISTLEDPRTPERICAELIALSRLLEQDM